MLRIKVKIKYEVQSIKRVKGAVVDIFNFHIYIQLESIIFISFRVISITKCLMRF